MPNAKASRKDARISGPILYSLKEAAEKYGFTVWFLRERIWRGELPFFQPIGGRKMYVRGEDIERLITLNLRRVE